MGDRARRILRMEEKLYVSGRGNTISMACTLVEVLKRQKIGKVASISTAMITFSVTRDEFAEYVADYHQRKVIEIFEATDSDKKGTLSFEDVESLKMSERFKANEEQIASAKEFMSKLKEKSMDLPTFIKYASVLIHPLLKDKVFKSVLPEFGIQVRGVKEVQADES